MRAELLADNLLAALMRGGNALQPAPPEPTDQRRQRQGLVPVIRAAERFALDAEATIAATVLAAEPPDVLGAIAQPAVWPRGRLFIEWDNVAGLGVLGVAAPIDGALRAGAFVEPLAGSAPRLLVTPVGEIVEPHSGIHAGVHVSPVSYLIASDGGPAPDVAEAARVLAAARLAVPVTDVLFGRGYVEDARAAGQGEAVGALAGRATLAVNGLAGASFRPMLADPNHPTTLMVGGKRLRVTNQDCCEAAFRQALAEFAGELRRTLAAVALLGAGADGVVTGASQRPAASRLAGGRLVPYLGVRPVTTAVPGRAVAERVATRFRAGALG